MLALATCDGARDVDADLPLLQAFLPDARIVVWDDPCVDWDRFDVVIIRSAWDYHRRRDEFLEWANRVQARSTLWNPVELIEWNTDKRYLFDLAQRRIPVVPTRFVEAGYSVASVELSGDLVIKPSIGAGSIGVVRTRHDVAAASEHIAALHSRGSTAMIQPYLDEVDSAGETDLVFLDGVFSHAVVKGPILTDAVEFEGGLYAKEQVERRTPTAAEIAVGEQVVAYLPKTAYARIDLLPTDCGPVVLEVELTEPSLYLNFDEGAPERAAAVFRSLSV